MAFGIGTALSVAGFASNLFKGHKAEGRASAATAQQMELLEKQIEVESEKWDIYKDSFLKTDQALSQMARELVPYQQEATQTALESVVEDRGFYEENIQPILEEMRGLADPNYEYARGRAAAAADQATDRQIDTTTRQLERYGVDPSSGAWQGAVSRAGAGQRAAMVNEAGERERQASFTRLGQVHAAGAGLGARSPGNLTQYGTTVGLTPNFMAAAGTANAAAGNAWQQAQGYGQAAGASLGSLPRDPFSFSDGGSQPPKKGYKCGGLVKKGKKGYANGGLVTGPGTGKSDSIPARVDGQEEVALSNGEYVIDADMVDNIVRQWLQGNSAGLQHKEMM